MQMQKNHHRPTMPEEELRELEERMNRGETTFDEEMEVMMAHGADREEAAFEAALERCMCTSIRTPDEEEAEEL